MPRGVSLEETMGYDPKNDRPYHDSIFILFDAINRADQMQAVADFVIATACPANHDFIITGWRAVLDRLNFPTDTFNVIAAVMAKQPHALKQAQIKAMSAKIADVFPYLRPRSSQDPVYMFIFYLMSRRQLINRCGVEMISKIEEYFAKVGLTHGQRPDHELELELRQMGVWRDRDFFDSEFSTKP